MEYLRQSITPHLYHLITLEMWFGVGLFCNGNNGPPLLSPVSGA